MQADNEATVVFTMDTDWADEEMLAWAQALFRKNGLPLTIFATQPYDLMAQADDHTEFGVHPNFFATQDHRGLWRKMRRQFPRATGFRCHGLFEYAGLLTMAAEAGFTYDSNLLMFGCDRIRPFQHPSGLVRVPMFWEDDDHFNLGRPWDATVLGLARPGLKVINFHPIHLWLNTVDSAQYDYVKANGFSRGALEEARCRDKNRGTRVLAEQMIETVTHKRLKTMLLKEVVHGVACTTVGLPADRP